MKLRVLCLVVSVVLLLPQVMQASVVLDADSCVAVGENQTRIYFTVQNVGIEDPICSFQLIPLTDPIEPECRIVDAAGSESWAWSLRTDGGCWWGAPPHDPPRLWCVGYGESRNGFYITIDPGLCCYTARYANHMIHVVYESIVCFTTCEAVPKRSSTEQE